MLLRRVLQLALAAGVAACAAPALGRARTRVREDVDAMLQRDPATLGRLDAALSSPGLHALWAHRAAHAMWHASPRLRLPARVLATVARAVTGVEIHPAARIGRRVVIDHGMGVVIGQTAIVGDDVLMYHGVTLGGRDARPGRRHPQVGDRVLLGAGATLLGPIVVGDDARIGAGAIVTRDVAPATTAIGRDGRPSRMAG